MLGEISSSISAPARKARHFAYAGGHGRALVGASVGDDDSKMLPGKDGMPISIENRSMPEIIDTARIKRSASRYCCVDRLDKCPSDVTSDYSALSRISAQAHRQHMARINCWQLARRDVASSMMRCCVAQRRRLSPGSAGRHCCASAWCFYDAVGRPPTLKVSPLKTHGAP